MAPVIVSAAMAEILYPMAHEFITRDAQQLTSRTSAINGKTPEELATEGRYNYAPSFAAAVIFLALYVIILLANLIQYFWYRAWFWWPMLFSVALELIGYVARAFSVKHLDNKNAFIIQTVLILIAPAVMAAACYMAFGRIVLWVVPKSHQTFRQLWMPFRYITPLFVSFDVLSFAVQCVGGAMVASADTTTKANKGKNVVLVGLGIQLVTFGFFVLASMRFAFVLRTKLNSLPLPTETNWRFLLTTVNAASATILIRSVYRFLEFVLGVHNTLSDNEVYFYCLDALLIFVVVAAFVCVHPGMFLPYIGFRRRGLKFSKNAGRGLGSRFALGKGGMSDGILLRSSDGSER
ncbi:MAG: hypothetical protein M1834_001054 [Cirrosporium novae-zelandiae]|nr:MAG: hypothetical protein M1834_001054 [Cirrosporium novae-zelandiae]